MFGFFVITPFHDWLPYLLVVASSSFIYVAVADLIPQLQRRLAWRQTAAQLGWFAVGLAIAALANMAHSLIGHEHGHDHDHDHEHEHAHEPAPQPAPGQAK